MVELITPGRQHKYVIGIDFGHAETSANLCEIEWDVRGEMQKSKPEDIVLWRNSEEKILVSAISKTKDGDIFIHRDALKYIEGNNFRIGFKAKPQSLKGEKEQLMVDFMRAVYNRVLQAEDVLTPDNHIVYIARPSGWQDRKSKELYCEMAIEAGIPLAGLTSESRAAIFYARNPSISFSTDISKGALVFDLGSSTLDLTYLSKTVGPFDQGDNLGASIIDDAIYKRMILQDNKQLAKFVQEYPEFADPLLYRARKFKESVYSRGEGVSESDCILPKQVLSDAPDSIASQLANIPAVELKASAEQLNSLADEESDYHGRIVHFLEEFKKKKIGENPINGVLLVGGASRMYFLPSLIAGALSIQENRIKREADPNLTVSRGIALLGTKDAITSVLQRDFKDSLPQRISGSIQYGTIKLTLSTAISDLICKKVSERVGSWVYNGEGYDKDSFCRYVIKNLKIDHNKIEDVCEKSIISLIEKSCKDIINDINDIISYYANEVRINSQNLSFQGILPEDAFCFIQPLMKDILPKIAERISNNGLMDFLRHILGKDKKNRELMNEKFSNGGYPQIKEIISSAVDSELTKIYPDSITDCIQNSIYDLMDRKLKEVRIPIE